MIENRQNFRIAPRRYLRSNLSNSVYSLTYLTTDCTQRCENAQCLTQHFLFCFTGGRSFLYSPIFKVKLTKTLEAGLTCPDPSRISQNTRLSFGCVGCGFLALRTQNMFWAAKADRWFICYSQILNWRKFILVTRLLRLLRLGKKIVLRLLLFWSIRTCPPPTRLHVAAFGRFVKTFLLRNAHAQALLLVFLSVQKRSRRLRFQMGTPSSVSWTLMMMVTWLQIRSLTS